MSYEDDRTRQVRTGQAVNLAIHMACNENIGSDDSAKVLARAAELLGPIVQFIDQAQEAALTDARTASVVQAFPGAQLEPAAQAQIPQANPVFVRTATGEVVPALKTPGPAATITYDGRPIAAVQPAPIPGAADGDPDTARLWTLYFQDPSAFWDNRQGKKNPKAPDFKHRQTGDGLWIESKRNPSWVKGRLA
jgi:antitoxin (DNA-binding transcriptional repressor) of toxin-antitoxin stability system